MRGSNWLLALGCGLLLSASGCCGYQCGGGCGGGCNECGTCAGGGPIYGRRPLSQAACGEDCCSGPCDNCGCDDGCQRNFCFHPFRWIGGLFYSNTWCGSCGGGCGCGNGCDGGYASQGAGGYSGGSSGGYSEGYSGYASGRPGCKNCNRGVPAYDGGDMSAAPDGEVMQGEASPSPTPAPPPKTSRRIYPSTQYN